jgi:enterochelin esterase family protein
MPLLPLKIFLSTGTPDDNTGDNRRFRRLLEEKGYQVEYIEVRQGHDWRNWKPLIDDVLLYFYGTKQAYMQ